MPAGYLALLRGINVGGNNKIRMADLAEVRRQLYPPPIPQRQRESATTFLLLFNHSYRQKSLPAFGSITPQIKIQRRYRYPDTNVRCLSCLHSPKQSRKFASGMMACSY